MRLWSTFLTLLALPLALALAAASDPRERLVKLATAGNGVIKLDHKTYDLLTTPNRDWSASILLTAMDKRRNCAPCKDFHPSWNSVAKAWTNTPKDQRDLHFFATADFDEASSIFQQLGLQSAPVVHVYAPTEGPRQSNKPGPYKYDFSYGFDPLPLAESLSNHTPIPIPYKAPFKWGRWVTIAFTGTALAFLLRFISPVLQSRWTWAVVTIVTSLTMTSGYMFTRIRNSPFQGGGGAWIAPGYQNQFGQEVQVIAMIYGLLAFAFCMQILIIPYQTSPSRQRIQVYLWSGVIMLVYSVLVTIFRIKNRGYPFKLLL